MNGTVTGVIQNWTEISNDNGNDVDSNPDTTNTDCYLVNDSLTGNAIADPTCNGPEDDEDDGIVNQAGEICDDGNMTNSDDCTNLCQLTFCGDAIVQNPNGSGALGEVCDDGNTTAGDGCSATCTTEGYDLALIKTL